MSYGTTIFPLFNIEKNNIFKEKEPEAWCFMISERKVMWRHAKMTLTEASPIFSREHYWI